MDQNSCSLICSVSKIQGSRLKLVINSSCNYIKLSSLVIFGNIAIWVQHTLDSECMILVIQGAAEVARGHCKGFQQIFQLPQKLLRLGYGPGVQRLPTRHVALGSSHSTNEAK